MANLMRYDPFRELWDVRNMMDRFMDDAFGTVFGGEGTRAWSVPLDVIENNDEYILRASIPGVNPDDLNITYSNNILTITGEVKREEETEEARYHMRERRFGKFSRSVHIPNRIEADDIDAQYESGELILHLPKSAEVKPKRIPVRTGQGEKVIEGRLSEPSKN